MKYLLTFCLALIIGSAAAGQSNAGEAAERKARSIAHLSAQGISSTDFLPVIETVETSQRRTEAEVTQRAIALAIVAVKGETRDHELGQALIVQFDAGDFFTPAERAFMMNAAPSDQDYVDFTWRYEGAAVMLWALGVLDRLPRPDRIADVPGIAAILRDLGTDGLRKAARLRPQSELLDAADLIYRTNWAVVDARLNNRDAPAGLDASVVYERHYALNWLIGYGGQAWDDISTDT